MPKIIYNGSISFVDYFYEKGQWTDGYLFDTVCRATFAPKNGYKCTKFYVSLGVNDSNFPAHEIIDQTRIGSNGSSTTHSLELSGSKEGISGGGSTSWSYDVDAQDVQNAFSETDVKTWRLFYHFFTSTSTYVHQLLLLSIFQTTGSTNS